MSAHQPPFTGKLPPALANIDTRLRGKHITSIDILQDRSLLRSLFNLADRYLKDDRKNQIEPAMAGKVMATVFYEPSTRTEWSFACAMMRLGGGEKRFERSSSSIKKNETLEDTIKILAGYSNVIVLRHSEPEVVERVARICDKPVINAGDGTGEHPTQALLDVFTIRREIGTVSNLIISLVGDLKHSRTIHSLAKLLCQYDIGQLRLVAPAGLELPKDILSHLQEERVSYSLHQSLEEVVSDSDVIYMTRIQTERFPAGENYQQYLGKLKITPLLMTKAKEKMIVMHPLPRNDEISPDFDDDKRAVYFRQAEYGLYVRMALLRMVVA